MSEPLLSTPLDDITVDAMPSAESAPDESKPILTAAQLAEIRARADAATPGDWGVRPPNEGGRCGVVDDADHLIGATYAYAYGRFESGRDNARFIAHARSDIPALLDHIDEISRSYQDLVERSAQEADRAQALVLAMEERNAINEGLLDASMALVRRKDEELAAHDDLHRAAANRIEQLVRDLALQQEATAGAREIIRLALVAMREPVTHTDARRAREILQKYHHECAVAAVKARREPAPFPTAPGASL